MSLRRTLPFGRKGIDTPATDGKRHSEQLYRAMRRSLHGWQCCTLALLAIILWDRVERWPLLAEKQYLPVVIAEHQDGSMRYVGEPDPNWRPSDRNILDEITWGIQTLRGRTKDADFDGQLWQRLYDRTTDKGHELMAADFKVLMDMPEKLPIRVRIISINKMSELSYDLRWEEKHENAAGKVVRSSMWRGVFSVTIDVARTVAGLRQNPKGVWLDQWSIAEDKV
jgi:type IV secretory pathway TrbF-like protein